MNNYNFAIKNLVRLVKIDSVKSERTTAAPFGESIRECLDATSDICSELGFEMIIDEGFYGFVDLNAMDEVTPKSTQPLQAKKTLGILAHLDVVPIGEGWTKGQGEISDGKIYGRGVADDKGPLIACLYAMKRIVDEKVDLKDNIRLIVGTDEESGSLDIGHYRRNRKCPDYGFSPDSDFPIVAFEKTILHLSVRVEKPLQIVSLCGGKRLNMVADSCELILNFDDKEEVSANVSYTFAGKSAHASKPDDGDNAIWKAATKLLDVLNFEKNKDDDIEKLLVHNKQQCCCAIGLDDDSQCDCETGSDSKQQCDCETGNYSVSQYVIANERKRAWQAQLINHSSLKKVLELASADALKRLALKFESKSFGETTINFGTVNCVRDERGREYIDFGIDMRLPKEISVEEVLAAFKEYTGILPTVLHCADYLESDKDSILFGILTDCFESTLKNEKFADCFDTFIKDDPKTYQPVITGGGTYARSMKNFVAFGPYVNGINNKIHDADEFLGLKHFEFLIEVYYRAIKALAGR